MKLLRKSPHIQTVVENLEVASTFWSRSKGLLGRKGLSSKEALWILSCNSVHTFFMRFSIDLVFLDKDMVIKKIVQNVPPGRLILPVWRASSVIEFTSGFLTQTPLNVGDELYVDR